MKISNYCLFILVLLLSATLINAQTVPSGTLLVTSGNDAPLVTIDSNGKAINFSTKNIPSGISNDVAFNFKGEVFVSAGSSGQILKVDSSGNVTEYISGLSNPTGIAFDIRGNLWVAECNSGKVSKIDDTKTITNVYTKLACPIDLMFNAEQDLYIIEYANGKITQIKNGVTKVITTLAGAVGMVLDSKNNLYVSQHTPSKISKITPTGEVLNFASVYYPEGLAIDYLNTIYSAGNNGVVSKIDTSGNVQTFVNIGGDLDSVVIFLDSDKDSVPDNLDLCPDTVNDPYDRDCDTFIPPLDCDDYDPNQHPGVQETKGKPGVIGEDDDCDGQIDEICGIIKKDYGNFNLITLFLGLNLLIVIGYLRKI